MKIGRVELPALKKIDKKPLRGGVYDITLTGVCFKNSTYTDSLDAQVENVQSLKAEDLSEPKLINAVGVNSPVPVDSKVAYNVIDYTGLKGFVAVKEVSETKSAEQLNIREVSISGIYMPDSIYKRNLQLGITDLANDWSITGRTLVGLPVNSTTDIVGATELYSVDTEDGTVNIYEAAGDEVAFSCELADEELGAVTVWDTNSTTIPTATDLANKSTGGVPWTKVLNREHDFSDNIVVCENAHLAVAFVKKTSSNVLVGVQFIYTPGGWSHTSGLLWRGGTSPLYDFNIYDGTTRYWPTDLASISVMKISSDEITLRCHWDGSSATERKGNSYPPFNLYITMNRTPTLTLTSSVLMMGHIVYKGQWASVDLNLGDQTFSPFNTFYATTTNYVLLLNHTDLFCVTAGEHSGKIVSPGYPFISIVDYPAGAPLFVSFVYFNIANLFADAEASTETTGTVVSDADASGGSALELLATGEYVNTWRFNPFSGSLPDGTYRLFIRYKADIATPDVLKVEVMDDTTATAIASATYTPASTGAYIYVYLEFTIDSTTDADNIFAQVSHNGTTEVLDIDYSLLVPITNGKNFPQDVAHDAMRLVAPRRELKVR